MSNAGAAKRKAKDKAYYKKCAKMAKKSAYELAPGHHGFLITSNNREKESIREGYNLLNEYADNLYGKVIIHKNGDGSEEEDEGSSEKVEETEIEDELKKEVADLKKEATSTEKRFQSVQTGVKSCCFIKTTLDKPTELMNSIMKDLEETRNQKTRFLLRMLPIIATCKPVPSDILTTAKSVAKEHLSSFKSFSILYKVRNNNVKREEIIEPLADHIKNEFPDIKVDLDNPEASVVVEVIRKTCCIGVVENYFGRAKYNLVELAQKTK